MNPLEQLRDIHPGEHIGSWPLAWGWWLLMVLTLTAMAALVVWGIHRRRKSLARRQALEAMAQISQHEPRWPLHMNALLKRLALTYYPSATVAALHGDDWSDFLSSKLPQKQRAAFAEQIAALQQCLYRENASCDFAKIREQVERWIRVAQWEKSGGDNV